MRLSIDTIQTAVAQEFDITVADMCGPVRARKLAWPRMVAMYLSRELTTRSLPEIGRHFGGRDHTTALHACRRIAELITGDTVFAGKIMHIRAALSAIMPSGEGFNVISLGEWLTLARRVNVPHVAARFVAEARVEDLKLANGDPDSDRDQRLRKFFNAVYDVKPTNDMLRWDFCAPEGIKAAMAKWAPPKAPAHIITLDEPRVADILDDLPPSQKTAAVWRRPWITARVEGGHPVEYRVFVREGKVIGVSNYYPQRVLRNTPQVEYEVKMARLYAEAMIAAQTQQIVNPQIVAAGLDPTLMHGTLDFIASERQLLFLEGGPPALPLWGAHACCFEGREITGTALGPRPDMVAA
jgi:hypothetical protein